MTVSDDRKGHRNRLREQFAADYGASMPDYELLELLLFHSVPRRDTKPAPQQAGPAALSCEDSSSGRKGYGRGQ